MVFKCDVLVVGAGVSGAVASLKLSKLGYTVILLEKLSKIGVHTNTKLDITEEVGIKKIIKDLNLKFHAKSNKSKWFSPKKEFLFESEVNDLFVKRGPEKDSFDAQTVNFSVSEGTKLFLNSEVKDFQWKDNLVVSVKAKIKGKNEEIIPKYVIGADGSNSKTLILSGLNKFEKKGVEIEGFGFVAKNLNVGKNLTHIFFDSELAPGGYFFVAKTSREFGVASLVVNKNRIRGNVKTYFNNFITKNRVIFDIVSSSYSKKYFYGSCKTVSLKARVKGNFLLVGDAGRVMDPIFGYGVRPAIHSGYLAANSINHCFENSENLVTYETQLKKELLFNERENHRIRKVFDKLDNSDFDFLVESAKYLDSKQNLADLIDNHKFSKKHLLLALIRKPHKTMKLTKKIMSQALFTIISSLLIVT